MNYISLINNQTVPMSAISEVPYDAFVETNIGLIINHPERHCVAYFGYKMDNKLKLMCCIADDATHEIHISSCLVDINASLPSFTAKLICFEKFEREIHENFGLTYTDHPWLKPLRYAFNRFDKTKTLANYPFYTIDSEELHEVGVGPIHAGVIEPGHFRFICNGEQILHLEIQLGYQHRGIEQLFIDKRNVLQCAILAENIAGDTVAGHATAFAQLWESVCQFKPTRSIDFSRTIAQELERIAIHTGDLSALCGDIAYQMGASVFGRLRTPIINFMQEWCGNRLAKGLIRPGRNPFSFTPTLAMRLLKVFDVFEPDFNEMCKHMFKSPSASSRFERTGVVAYEDALSLNTVGMAARSSGLSRDIRVSHPYNLYPELLHQPIIKRHGDVYSRVQVRKFEVLQSIAYLRKLIVRIPDAYEINTIIKAPQPDAFAISLVEGWRGEICHCAVTDARGHLLIYKIKDPSFHNWMALAMAVRNNEISDFPVNNKSFNLSYAGHDL